MNSVSFNKLFKNVLALTIIEFSERQGGLGKERSIIASVGSEVRRLLCPKVDL